MTDLPHDKYMAAVADALTTYGLEPDQWWASEDDSGANTDRLDGVFQWRNSESEHWLGGVYLTWDQYDGWRLIENGGGRNVSPLSEASGVYADPRQIAADTRARLTHGLDGQYPGPICPADVRWDALATREAVDVWGASMAG